MFRCKWYNTSPKGKNMLVENNLTLVDITSEWYKEEPFILATQAQQIFYLNDLSRGKNWMIVQKVNHRNIFDIVEREVEDTVTDDVFQEDDSRELPHFCPTEEVVEASSLVREEIDPVFVPQDMLRTEELNLNDNGLVDIDEDSDDGRLFIDDEPILEFEIDENLSDLDRDNEDDDFDGT